MNGTPIDQLGQPAPGPKFQSDFPPDWTTMCPFCMLLYTGNFANQNGWVVSLFPGRKTKTSRMQVYIHPEDVILPYAQAVPPEMVRQYWVFSLEQVTLKCLCGREKQHPIEPGYYRGFGRW
jgi:hypothetical protein